MKVFFNISLVFVSSLMSLQALSLSDYLKQVEEGNKSLQGAKLSATSALKRANEANLVVLPTLVSSGSYFEDDFIKSTFPIATKSEYQAKVGIKENTPFGISAEVASVFQRQNLRGYAGSPYSFSQNQLTLVASLWRNILGAEVRAQKNQIEAASMASHHSENFQAKSYLANAESTYWTLALARSSLEFQKNSLKRSQRLYDWNKKKSKVDLVNESSISQAAANLAIRKTALQAAENFEREMRLMFNTLRGKEGDEVEGLSQELQLTEILSLQLPEVVRLRDDFLAQKYSLDVQASSAKVSRERNSPDIRFFSTLTSSGQANGDHSKSAFADSFQFKDNGYVIGVSLEVPLSLLDLKRAHSGWDGESQAASLKKDYIDFQNAQEFKNLKASFSEAVELLKLRIEVETAQKKRLESDQNLFDRGRTTTFQLIQAEEDYSASQLGRIDAEASALTLYAKLKLFL